jgi:hypothetical protein
MNIFEFFEEEEELIEKKLGDLVSSFTEDTREEIFDDVKLILDLLKGHCDKQKAALLDKIAEFDGCKQSIEETVKARDLVIAQIGDLVMVHVDEPGYKEYLVDLLKRVQSYFKISETLYKALQNSLPEASIKSLDEAFTSMIHSDVGFNSLQESTS